MLSGKLFQEKGKAHPVIMVHARVVHVIWDMYHLAV